MERGPQGRESPKEGTVTGKGEPQRGRAPKDEGPGERTEGRECPKGRVGPGGRAGGSG